MTEVARKLYQELIKVEQGKAGNTEQVLEKITEMFFEAKKEMETLKGIQARCKAIAGEILDETGEIKKRTEKGTVSWQKGRVSRRTDYKGIEVKARKNKRFAREIEPFITTSTGKRFVMFRG
jgi:hypothetical protein